MKIHPLATLLALPALFACATTESSVPPTPEEMMEAMTQAGTPGAEHRMLDAFVGTWDADITMWMDPNAPPEKTTGRMTNEWILDGRFLEQRFEGTFGGQEFHGRGVMGYDVAAGEFIGTWMDSMSTTVTTSSGRTTDGGRTFQLATECTDPMTGEPALGEQVVTIEGADRHAFVMYGMQDGERTKHMEIVYTRAR